METDIHKALVQLEDNLSKLGMAREQVEGLTKGGQALTEKAAVLLEDTARLMELVKTDMQAIVEMFAARMEATEQHIDRMIEKGSTAVSGTLEEMKQSVADVGHAVEKSVADLHASARETIAGVAQEQKGQLNNFQTTVEGKLGQSLSDFKSKLSQFESLMQKVVRDSSIDINNKMEAFAVSAREIKEESEESLQRITMVSEKALTKQVHEAEALLVQLKETNAGIHELLSHFHELDLAGKWLSLERELKDFRLEAEARFAAADARMEALRKGQTYLLYALGGIALLLLILKFV